MSNDEYIQMRVQKHYDYLISLGFNVVGVFAQGSMNYGLFERSKEYQSDVDTKAIILPTLDDLICGNKMVSTKYDFEGEQIDVKDIRIMVDIWKQANPSYLEILFTKYKVINPIYINFMQSILDMGSEIATMHPVQLARCIAGMSNQKLIAMEHPYPSIIHNIEKYGYDGKQVHHIIRLTWLITEIFCCDIPFGEAIDISYNKRLCQYLMNIKKYAYDTPEYHSLEWARAIAKQYDDDTQTIKEEVKAKLEDKLNSEIYQKLLDIVHPMVKYAIIKQIKETE